MNNLKWNQCKIDPWVGCSYFRDKQKILVVGLSTYHDKKINDDKQNQIINTKRASEGCRPNRYWTNIMQTITNRHHTLWDIEEESIFWNSVALYNYIQTIQEGTKDKSLPKDFRDSEKAFEEVLQKLKPKHILIFSPSVFDYIRWKMKGDALVLRLPHPSRGIKMSVWSPVISEHLKQ